MIIPLKRNRKLLAFYRAAILSEDGNKMEDVLDCAGVQYPNALNLLFADMVKQAVVNGDKYRVIEDLGRQ